MLCSDVYSQACSSSDSDVVGGRRRGMVHGTGQGPRVGRQSALLPV